MGILTSATPPAPAPAVAAAIAAAAAAADAAIAVGEADAAASAAKAAPAPAPAAAVVVAPPAASRPVIAPRKRLDQLFHKIDAYQAPAPFQPSLLLSGTPKYPRLPAHSGHFVGQSLAHETRAKSARGVLTSSVTSAPPPSVVHASTTARDSSSTQLVPSPPPTPRKRVERQRRVVIDYGFEESAWMAIDRGDLALLSAQWLCKPTSKLGRKGSLPPSAYLSLEELKRLHKLSGERYCCF